MHNPLEITFKGIPKNSNIEQLITEKFEKIQEISNGVIKCHVVIEALSHHHQKGNEYCVRLDLKLAHFPDIIVKEKSKEEEDPLTKTVRVVFKKAHELVRKQIERRKKKVIRPDKAEAIMRSSEEFEEEVEI